jgi:glycosyltransferase involved in cell wall biosynthesis
LPIDQGSPPISPLPSPTESPTDAADPSVADGLPVPSADSSAAPVGADQFGAADRERAAQPWVVFVSDIPFLPPIHGNRARILQMVRAMRAAGYQVGYIYWERYPYAVGHQIAAMTSEVDELLVLSERKSAGTPGLMRKGYAEWVRSLSGTFGNVRKKQFEKTAPGKLFTRLTQWWGIEDADPRPWCPPIVRDAVEFFARTRKVSAVVGEYAYSAQALPVVQKYGILGVVDTHDCWHRWQQNLRRQNMPPAWFIAGRELEQRLLSMADCVLAIQRNEQDVFREMVGSDKVLLCEHGMSMPDASIVRPVASKSLCLVASNNPFNVEGLVWFLKGVWPLVLAREPEATLHCYGLICDMPACDGPNLVKHGYVGDLAEAYDPHRLVINPVRTGTGLKIKTVEGLLHGRATVATATGADGVEDAEGQGLLVRDDEAGFAEAVLTLLRDEKLAFEAGKRGYEYAERRFASHNVYRPLIDRIRAREPNWDPQRILAVAEDAYAKEGAIRVPEEPLPALEDSVWRLWNPPESLDESQFACKLSAIQREFDERSIPWREVEFRCGSTGFGGAELQALRVAEGLRRYGYSVRFRIPEGAEALAQRLIEAEIPHRPFASSDALAEEPPGDGAVAHLVCTHLLDWFDELEGLVDRNVGWVATYQLTGPWRPRWLPNDLEWFPEKACLRLRDAWKAALRVNFVSELNRKTADLIVSLDDVAHSAILNGVPAPDSEPALEARIPTEDRPFVWLWIGRFHVDQKNPAMALEAFEEALRKAPGVPQELWFVGSGPDEEAAKRYAEERGLRDRVRFWGWQADPSKFLAQADGYLSSSDFEGSSLALAEAMHAGLAIVATAVEGNADEIAHSVTGRMCQRDDAFGMGAEMAACLADSAGTLLMRKRALAAARRSLTLLETQRRYALLHLDAAGIAAERKRTGWQPKRREAGSAR